MGVNEGEGQSTDEQIEQLLEGVRDDHYAVIQLCELLLKVTDVETVEPAAMEGVHRVIGIVLKHGEAACDATDKVRHLRHQCA